VKKLLTQGRHQAELDGVTQAYEVAGHGPVCFVHAGGPGFDSDYLQMPLLEQYMTLVYLDPIGTGGSGFLPGGDYSVAEYARRLELLRDYLGVTDGILLGHSHGGFVALQHALNYPGRMRGLIVYSSAPTDGPDLIAESKRQIAALVQRWPDRPEVATAYERFIADIAGNVAPVDVDTFREYWTAIEPAYYADFRKTVAELGKPPEAAITKFDPDRKPCEWDVRGQLGAIKARALVLTGTFDFMCPPVWSEEIHKEITGSEFVQFIRSGHFAHIEQPEEFSQSIYSYLGRLS
jgi:pimeloyl-ACP methyl ester carboxylesterase